MSRWCDHVACTKDLLDWFLWAVEQPETYYSIGEITNYLYNKRKVIHHSSNHSWEGVHRVLTDDDSDDLDFDAGDYPLCLCIHGGEWLHSGPRTVTLVEADELPELVTALSEIDQPWVVSKLLAMQQRLSPRYDNWDMHEYGDEVWWEIEELLKFYKKAAKAKLPVVCTISH